MDNLKTPARLMAETAIRMDNDVNGNPRYYFGIADFSDNDGMFRPLGAVKYRGKRYGAGWVFQSYNLESDIQRALVARAAERAPLAANPFDLPLHLAGMTQAKWDAMSKAERDAARDTSRLNPQLMPFIGQLVKVYPKRPFGRSTFRVGMTTGWRPTLMAVKAGAWGSSDLIGVDETFERIERV